MKEHDIAANKLNDWKKRFVAVLDALQKEVTDFRSKDRMSEAETYVNLLNEIAQKLEDANAEVNYLFGDMGVALMSIIQH